jgi:hypothetical protein
MASVIEKPKPSRKQRFWTMLRARFNIIAPYRAGARQRITLIEHIFFLAGGIMILGGNIIVAFESENYNTIATALFISTLVSVAFVVWGICRWRIARADALEQFRRATLVNLFIPQFFYFALLQFAALPGFIFSLALLSYISHHMRDR